VKVLSRSHLKNEGTSFHGLIRNRFCPMKVWYSIALGHFLVTVAGRRQRTVTCEKQSRTLQTLGKYWSNVGSNKYLMKILVSSYCWVVRKYVYLLSERIQILEENTFLCHQYILRPFWPSSDRFYVMKKDYRSEGLSLTINVFEYLKVRLLFLQGNNKIYICRYND
jgi:hypothetical protein